MANAGLCLLSVFVFLSVLQKPIFVSAVKQSYVVYLGGHSFPSEPSSLDFEKVTNSHYELLGSVMGSTEKARGAIFYSYQRYINGFAAILEEEEAAEIKKDPNVISVFPNKGRKLHTTHSWSFLGLERNGKVAEKSIWEQANFGEDVIIGNLDTGVWPKSKSFNDDGMGPIPKKWKGVCQFDPKDGGSSLCNKKLIGARYFNKGYDSGSAPPNSSFTSPVDHDGHGTHTLSTAAGRFVTNASIFGLANGTAKGGSPNARVAAYKVCWPPINGSECFDADILAGFEAAINDGVDVLSVSLGGNPSDFFEDGIAIGSFHAVKNGIVVVCSGGNSGPMPGSVSNVAPWILTVAASTIDRDFTSYASLGNGKQYKGESLSSEFLQKQNYPLISSVDAKAFNAVIIDAQLCNQDSLDAMKVKGKIVLCGRGQSSRVEKGETVRLAGGVGMILANDEESGDELIADAHTLPATHVTADDGHAILSYINSTSSPVAYVNRPITELGVKPAPVMAAFSSQGPNTITPEILKPDITAPGVNILAAFPGDVSATDLPDDKRRILFNVESGTSMSCPHVAGIVGLLRKLHPDWSPAAIRSAIMTTSRTRSSNVKAPIKDSTFHKATPFSYGAGHVRPNGAMDPGLIYDLTTDDYLKFLCSLGYNPNQIAIFAGNSFKCPPNTSLLDLNYPSITVPRLTNSTTITRTVRNVGSPAAYTVRVRAPRGVTVWVEPKSLKFDKTREEKTFKVTLVPKQGGLGSDYFFGQLAWSDGVHHVNTPIVVSSNPLQITRV